MQKNKNRQGLALGAVVALISSLFVMTAPSQASETSVVAFPTTGLESQTTILAGEAFDVSLRLGTGVAATFRDYSTNTNATLGVTVTKPANVPVTAVFTGAGASASPAGAAATIRSLVAPINGTSTSTAVETAGTSATFGIVSSGSPKVAISLGQNTSVSASVTITVTPFLDLNADGDQDSGEPSGTAMNITFLPWSALGATLSVATPIVGEHNLTVSFAVAANAAINWTQMDNKTFKFTVTSSGQALRTTISAAISAPNLVNASAATGFAASAGLDDTGSARAYSASFALEAHTFVAADTFSANIMYGSEILVTSTTATVGAYAVDGTTVSPVTGVNVVRTAGTTADARVNSAFSLAVYPYSASITTSVAVASVLTITETTAADFSIDTGVSVNGTLYTSSAALLAANIAIPAGTTTVAIATVGQTGTPQYSFTLTSQLKSVLLDVHFVGTAQVVVATPAVASGLAGAAKTFAVTAKDQWGVSSIRTDQRIAASVVLGGSTSTTVSAAVVNGAASVVVTPTPATRTGSAVVTFTLQTFNQSTQLWTNASGGTPTDTSNWNVYSYVAGTDAFTSRTVSVSASVSYGVNLSWSATVAIGVLNSYSDVVVSAPGLMIQNADAATVTASDTLTIAANGQAANLKFTSRLVGTYTVTFTSGTATTTSEIVFDAAAATAGSTLTFDKTSIAAGTTTTVTGTLKDVNGNPVQTSGTADVAVAWTGKGLPFGNSTTMETDAAGQLTFYVLVLSGEVGDAAIAATYKPAGAAVDTDNITVVQAVAVGKAAATAAADQKVNVGSFKGYVALYAKGYAGQKMTAIVAGKWIKVDALASNFERVVRYTGAGYTITTKIYIDGVLKGTFSTVTK